MEKKGIVLGYRILEKGIEANRDKSKVIEKLHLPISVKGARSFLGHAGFYRRFIKDFSKISHHLCKLLKKECNSNFDESFLQVFGELKEKLVSAPIIISPY